MITVALFSDSLNLIHRLFFRSLFNSSWFFTFHRLKLAMTSEWYVNPKLLLGGLLSRSVVMILPSSGFIIRLLFTCGSLLLIQNGASVRASGNNTTLTNDINYSVGLLYPLSSATTFAFVHSFGGFILGINTVNELAKKDGVNIFLNSSIIDTASNPGNNPFYPPQQIEFQTLEMVAEKSLAGVDAFIGPGIEKCACDAKLAAAYKKPMVGYVSACNTRSESYKTLFKATINYTIQVSALT